MAASVSMELVVEMLTGVNHIYRVSQAVFAEDSVWKPLRQSYSTIYHPSHLLNTSCIVLELNFLKGFKLPICQ